MQRIFCTIMLAFKVPNYFLFSLGKHPLGPSVLLVSLYLLSLMFLLVSSVMHCVPCTHFFPSLVLSHVLSAIQTQPSVIVMSPYPRDFLGGLLTFAHLLLLVLSATLVLWLPVSFQISAKLSLTRAFCPDNVI